MVMCFMLSISCSPFNYSWAQLVTCQPGKCSPVLGHLVQVMQVSCNDILIFSKTREMVKKKFLSCDGNSGFSHDLILVEVSEWDDIVQVWFIIFSVCKRFGS